MMEIIEQASGLKDQIAGWYKEFHQIPELDLELPLTSSLIRRILDEMVVPYETFAHHSGIVATISGTASNQGKTVALRADIDALPIKELSNLSYASKNDNMHACGHDGHTAMLLGAGKILSSNRDMIKGTVRLIFQPGEETSGGAMRMLDGGVFRNPRVDMVLGQHISILTPELPAGHFGFYSGPFMASRDKFHILIKGKGGHGAMPDKSIDPIIIAAHLITALQSLVSREISATDAAVLTVGTINGGEASNIIPETVEMTGTVRCLDEKIRDFMENRMREVCYGVCASFRASCTVTYERGYPVACNDPVITEYVIETATTLFGADKIHRLHVPLMGSEDMAFFLQATPGSYWFLSTPSPNQSGADIHSPQFKLDDSLLYLGTALMSQVSIDWLSKV
jgi:amidohydrolase